VRDPKSILIVEDNRINVLVIRSMLRKFGYEPAVATDGVEGVELAAALRPRLILMDLAMPRMDGMAAAAAIRDRSCGDPPAIVAVTANASKEQRAACAAAGFEGLLQKPIALADLIGTVRRWVGEA
jgi:CheY-like chemotaxis protein